MKTKLVIFLVSIFSLDSISQEVRTSLEDAAALSEPALARHLIQVDLIPTLLSATTASKPGAGLIYHLRLSRHFAIGAFADLTTIGSENGILFYREVELERIRYGLELRGYLSRFGQGFYAAAGPAVTNVTARAQARPLNFSEFRVSDSEDQTGFVAKLGYTFGRRMRKNAIILDLALEYGTGNQIGYSGSTAGRFEVDEVTDSFSLNAGIGARF